MRYSNEDSGDAGTPFVPLKQIYCSNGLAEACRLVRAEYDRPLDHAAQIAFEHVAGKVVKKKKTHRAVIDALIGEIWLYDMLVDWLRHEKDWDIQCPITSQHVYDNGELRKLKWGNRVGVVSDEGDAEIDCLSRYGNCWIIGEAKSGVNSYDNEVVNRRISRLRAVVRENPCFVLGVPSDHQVIRDGTHEYIEKSGGRVIVFNATSAQIHEKATQLYRRWMNPVDEVKNSHPASSRIEIIF
jgi:hypothetical protein